MSELGGKVAIITGAGSGIGEACALLFAERGAKVVVADIDLAKAEAVAARIGAEALPFKCDVADPADCKNMVETTVRHFGALHIAVNNAGIGGLSAPVGGYTPEAWRTVMSINLDGVFYCMNAEIPEMLKTGNASIVNIASILGSVGFAYAPAYVAAKHGVVGLSKTAALEYSAQGIRVNSVGPGFIRTPLLSGALDDDTQKSLAAMHASGRMGEPEEVAELVAFLASDRASNCSGGYYLVDGGFTAR